MNLPYFNIFHPNGAQFKREIAHFSHLREVPCFCSSCPCNMNPSEQDPSKDCAPYCQHRYPSPDRPIKYFDRSVRGSQLSTVSAATNRRASVAPLDVHSISDDSFKSEINWESSISCARRHSSSSRSRHLASQDALIQMESARSQVQALASSLPKFSEQIKLEQCCSARQQVHSATTQASVTKPTFLRSRGNTQSERRRVRALPTFLRLKDSSHV